MLPVSIYANKFNFSVYTKEEAVGILNNDVPVLVSRLQEAVAKFEAEEKKLKDEQALAAKRALFVPGTRVYYVECGNGNRRYGVVSAKANAWEPKFKNNDDPLRVYAYWDGNTQPEWMGTDQVFLAGS